MEKILIQLAIKELKELDEKIKKSINKLSPIAVVGKVDATINNKTQAEFSEAAVADYENVLNLINRRDSIKAAIVESNAKTKIKVADKEYTVAQAIELNKDFILDNNFKLDLLSKMKRAFRDAQSQMEYENRNINSDEMANTLLSGKPNMKDTNLNDFMNSYRENNEFALVDPLKLQDVIDKAEEEYNNFKMNVDEALQCSNCTTYIEIP